ncbi:MAG: T9SS type A sorting domain-containing protein [Clostridium sp.]|nr:T9SS type A sorting domain-containing protein [Clostridium sp.]
MNRYISIILSIIFLVGFSLTSQAGVKLIKSASQLSTNAPNPDSRFNDYTVLLDSDPTKRFLTDTTYADEQHYLTVKFEDGISMEDDDNLVVVLRRPARFNDDVPTKCNPTAMEIRYTFDPELKEEEWEPGVLARVYFVNRGSKTLELSEAMPAAELAKYIKKISGSKADAFGDNPSDVLKQVKGLKFVVTMNNGHFFAGKTAEEKAKEIRPMLLAGFQLYKQKPGEVVVDHWVDRFRLDTDINYAYENHKFKNTQGVLEAANRNISHYTNESVREKDDPALNTLEGKPWKNFDKNTGKWMADKEFLEERGIEMPEYSWVTAENNPILLDEDNVFAADNKLQNTATIEHLLYAVQGEPIVLYPFYTLPSVSAYLENFIHWYDYPTGGHVTDEKGTELLGFVADGSGVFHSKNHGWYASKEFKTDSKPITVHGEIMEIRTVEDYKEFVEKVNEGNAALTSATLMNDLEFGGLKIAPIGTNSSPWQGVFKGGNYALKGLVIDSSDEGAGVFGCVGDGAVIENLIIDKSCSIRGRSGYVGVVGKLVGGGTLKMNGVVNLADITGSNTNAAGLLGGVANNPSKEVNVYFNNCAFDGKLNGPDASALLVAWMGRPTASAPSYFQYNLHIDNVIVTGNYDHGSSNKGMEFYRWREDYHNADGSSLYHFNLNGHNAAVNTYGHEDWAQVSKDEVNTAEFLANYGNGEWTVGENGYPMPKMFNSPISAGSKTTWTVPITPSRKHGTYATFFYPRTPFDDGGEDNGANLRGLHKNEYVIAADMSQTFSYEHNVKDGEIIEPIIQFRHIFRVRDGRAFADTCMASKEGNDKFIKQNRRRITAAANKPFQIRLDHPYPVERTTRGVFYYKIDDTDYRRICSRKIRVLKVNEDGTKTEFQRAAAVNETYAMNADASDLKRDQNGNVVLERINKDWVKFYPSGMFDGQGSRTVDGIDYYVCGGGGHFFRMLQCDGVPEGTYIVQVIGTDYDGNVIHLFKDPKEELLVQEFEITFLPPMASLMVTEEELADPKYKSITQEELELRFEGHQDKIDFDEYRALHTLKNASDYIVTRNIDSATGETLPNGQEVHYLRWPLPWENSNYGFGYNLRGDYSMYMITDNQAATPYHSYGLNKEVDNFDTGYHGLFDRRFYDKNGTERGYFYYVNAADDPGIIARMELSEFCPGTTIHVSCWIAEFSGSSESANLSFNFVARLDNGDRVPMHSHVTGYVGEEGTADFSRLRNKWLYIYSSFVPILTDKEIPEGRYIDHYEIEIDNNAKSSAGADYAVDDIRVFTAKPVVTAKQLDPLCSMTDKVRVQISTPFEVLLQTLGEAEATTAAAGKEIKLYYSFLDKDDYEKSLAENPNDDKKIFDDSVVKFEYDGENEGVYGELILNTYLDSNKPYNQEGDHVSNQAYYTKNASGKDIIVFNTDPKDDDMRPGKRYIVAILTKPKNGDFGGGIEEPSQMPELFVTSGIKGDCSKSGEFTVVSAHHVKIDGMVQDAQDPVDACRNQSPTVQIDLYAKAQDINGNPASDELVVVDENARFDWYAGPYSEFAELEDGKLWEAINMFREVYPEATDENWKSMDPDDVYKEEMRELILKYTEVPEDGSSSPKLFIGQSSYSFPSLLLEEGETEREEFVLAIPIGKVYEKQDAEGNEQQYLICTAPTEVRVQVRQRAPRLASGIFNIQYPEYYKTHDVPLRISLDRVEAASTEMKSLARQEAAPLILPFRAITPVTSGVQNMIIPNSGSPIQLVYTNDPQYKDLAGAGKDENDLWVVGDAQKMTAQVGKENSSFVQMVFYNKINGEDGLIFKEGYQYRMRYLFSEQAPLDATGTDEVCTGHVVFTLKIVPEYQEWVGGENLNWNNDDNWRRVEYSDLKAADGDPALTKKVTDGSNANAFSYAPLDFTKVVIPQGANVPELFKVDSIGIDLNGAVYGWDRDPSERKDENIGAATTLVQYEMIQRIEDGVNATYARPWLSNMCEQIHFESGAEIGQQQWLRYEKASVDMEVDPSRWYTLSSPLQGTLAGDMYLPTADARQNTEYFKPITYDPAKNNRFKPAVFQRSWNTAKATVYNYDGHDGHTTDVSIVANWSNVYNDVEVEYMAGNGFSIKTDLAGVSTGESEKVMFRLPKADESYWYYTEDGKDSGDFTKLKRERPQHRLNAHKGDITVKAADRTNRLFLVGNPFMAHMDMKEFLDANEGVIERKYWILDGAHQGAAVMNDAEEFDGTIDEARYLAPMQGFFVEAKEETDALELIYDAETMAKTVNDKAALSGIVSRSGGYEPTALKITAKGSGSSAVIVLNDGAKKGYSEEEDAMFVADGTLEADALVYTVGGGTAMTVNALPGITSTEVGVVTKDDADATLVFEGVDEGLGLMLYDAEEETYTDLHEGMEYEVKGAKARRLYIVSGAVEDMASSLEIVHVGNGVRVTSTEGELTVRVFDISGRLVDSRATGENEIMLTLDKGIYIVEATDAEERKTEKVAIR